MKRLAAGLWLVVSALPAAELPADQIMLRVAANQDRAQQLRAQYRFHQNVLVRVQRSNGKLAREEIRDYRVTPTDKGLRRELLHVSGKVVDGRRVIPFDQTEFRYKNTDIDGEVVSGLIDDLGGTGKHRDSAPSESKTRDGIDRDMFPLSSKAQAGYTFTLKGEEEYRGHHVYRIDFSPKKSGEAPWAGEALIDKEACQPVLITTHLATGLPVAVKILLGTDVKQLGFKVTYQKFDDDVWFPVSYGGELRFRVLFLYARRVSMGLVNSDFERADVRSTVEFALPEVQ